MSPSQTDPVIDEIRETRRQISARFDNDPVKLVAYYMALQKQTDVVPATPSNSGDQVIEPKRDQKSPKSSPSPVHPPTSQTS